MSEPALSSAATPRVTSRRSWSADTHDTTASTLPASCARLAQGVIPSSVARACALGAPRFQTAVSSPARCRLRAMCDPMAPSPTKPARIFFVLLMRPGGRGRHYRGLPRRAESAVARAGAQGSAAVTCRGSSDWATGTGGGAGASKLHFRHAAAGGLYFLAGLHAIRVGVRIRQVLATAVSGGFVDAP